MGKTKRCKLINSVLETQSQFQKVVYVYGKKSRMGSTNWRKYIGQSKSYDGQISTLPVVLAYFSNKSSACAACGCRAVASALPATAREKASSSADRDLARKSWALFIAFLYSMSLAYNMYVVCKYFYLSLDLFEGSRSSVVNRGGTRLWKQLKGD